MNYQDTFRALAAITAPSGFETPVLDAIESLARPFATDMRRDALGNLIVHRAGAGQRVMLITHADTFGLIVTYRDEKGYYRFGLLGGAEPAMLVGLPVRFANGAQGVIGCDGGVSLDKIALRHLYLDLTDGEIAIGDACAVALVIRAGSAPSNMALVEHLESLAPAAVQRTVDPAGQFAMGRISGTRSGICVCGVGIPARRAGQLAVCDPADIRACADLVLAAL